MNDVEVCRKVRLHAERMIRLKEKYFFDEKAARQAVWFIENNIRQWKDPHAGKPLRLSWWQRYWVVEPLMGLKLEEDGPRLFREAYLQLPRKNGKTTLSAGLLLLLLFTDGEGQEIYTAATKRDQARIAFTDCEKFVRKSPPLLRRSRIYKQSIEVPKTSSRLMPLSSDHNSMDGLNVSAALIDELHAHPTGHVHDVIVTGTGAREQPLVINITTAGEGVEGVCKDMYDYGEQVLEGTLDDDSFFCLISEADKDLDWTDPRAFRQANLNLGISVKEEYLERELKKALATPSYRRTYRRYTLNRWVEGGADGWFSDGSLWANCRREFCAADLRGRKCYGGLDLASTTDLAALALLFPWEEKKCVRILVYYWMPAENLIERVQSDQVPYDAWRDDGWVKATEGNVIDYEVIVEDIKELRKRYDIRQVAYDEWNAQGVYTALTKDGLEMVKFVQGLRSFHPPSMEWERLVTGGGLHHDGNPVTTWCMANVQVLRDQSEKIRPVKDKKSGRKRIDGVVAGIMGLDALMRGEGVEPEIPWDEAPDNLRELLGL